MKANMKEMIRKNDLMYNSLEALNTKLTSCPKKEEKKVIGDII